MRALTHKMLLLPLRLVVGVFVAAAVPAVAHASYIYSYVGNNYDNFESGSSTTSIFSGTNYLTAEFAVDSAIQPNSFGVSLQPIYWKISDGSFAIDSSQPFRADINEGPPGTSSFLVNASITTGANGAVIAWNFGAQEDFIGTYGLEGYIHLASEGCYDGCLSDDASSYDFGDTADLGSTYTAGTWTVTQAPVPLPATALLLLSGLAGLGFLARISHPSIAADRHPVDRYRP